MKPTAILSLAFVLMTAGATAQTLSADRTVLKIAPSADQAGCPVSMEAHHGSAWLQRKSINGLAIDPGMNANQAGQQIHLKMTNQQSRDIVSLQITVHGLSSRARFVPASAAADQADLSKSIRLTTVVKSNADAASDLSLSRFTTVTTIHLDAVAYADGSVWRASSQQACSVTPAGLMLAGIY